MQSLPCIWDNSSQEDFLFVVNALKRKDVRRRKTNFYHYYEFITQTSTHTCIKCTKRNLFNLWVSFHLCKHASTHDTRPTMEKCINFVINKVSECIATFM